MLFRIITIEMITVTGIMTQGMAMTMKTVEMMLMPMMRTRTRMPRAWRGGRGGL